MSEQVGFLGIKMGYICLALGILIVLIQPTITLDHKGVNVCSREESYTTYVNKSRTVKVRQRYTTPFCGWWGKLGNNCTRYRWVNKTLYHIEPQRRNRTVYECCPGWKPQGNSCPVECENWTYGVNCNKNCTCVQSNTLSCHKKTGECRCKAKFTNEKCNERQECENWTYGVNCTKNCTCVQKNTLSCHNETGKCRCKAKYINEQCSKRQVCEKGKYGRGCKHSCPCNGRGACDDVDGYVKCFCDDGYEGERCEHKCDDFLHGQDCTEQCLCNQTNTAWCQSETGRCHCLPGWQGRDCNEVCGKGRFGYQCKIKCNCTSPLHEDGVCSHINGTCLCAEGRYGNFCNESGPHVLRNISSGNITAKEGDLVNLLCSAQGEPPVTFTWKKHHKLLKSLSEMENSQRSSFLVLTLKDQTSFGKYVCHIRDRFGSATHTIWIRKDTAFQFLGQEKREGSEKYLAGIVVLAILLVISLVALAYFVYQNRLKSSSTQENLENETKNRNDSKDIYDNPDKDYVNNYEAVDNERVKDDQATYTDLDRNGEKGNDDHVYCQLNKAQMEYVNQETGF